MILYIYWHNKPLSREPIVQFGWYVFSMFYVDCEIVCSIHPTMKHVRNSSLSVRFVSFLI